MFYTTLNCIHQCGPCCEGWEQLLKHLGKTKADDEPLPLGTNMTEELKLKLCPACGETKLEQLRNDDGS